MLRLLPAAWPSCWLVTVNDSPANRALFAGHQIQPVVSRSQSVNLRDKPAATFGELIIQRRKKGSSGAVKPILKSPLSALKRAA